MTEYQLVRFTMNGEATAGGLFRLGPPVGCPRSREFRCFTLEDPARETKIPGRTRIPAGRYRLALRKVGGFHGRYAQDPRTRPFHIGMIQLLDVPNFTHVLMHMGNSHLDTDGCVLLGLRCTVPGPRRNSICLEDSFGAYSIVYQEIAPKLEAGEEVWLHITDLA